MKHFASLGGATAMLLALPATLHAQGLDLEGNWYIQGGGGLNWALDQDGTSSDVSQGVPPFPLNGETDTGWLAGGAIGYAWANGFRTELEGVYRSNDVESLSAPTLPFALTGVGGQTDAVGIMANVLYDIDTGTAITPYLGGGVGAGNVDYEVRANGSVATADTWGVALQGIAGVSYALSDSFELFTDYRYFTVLDSTVSGVDSAGDPFTIDDDYASPSVFFGARYHFLPPPPPPPAPAPVAEEPPPPAPAQDRFIVFFDWDRS
ncbi:MAG: outer membrane beta-barrel protein, partial [Azospirillaceae bacterium]